MSSAKGLADGYSPYEVGTGRLDVAAAVRTTVRGTGSLFFGNYDLAARAERRRRHQGPRRSPTTAPPTSRSNLALTRHGGAFTLGASTVTVPAGGKATVPVTGDPQAVDFGRHVGYVVGTDAATGTAGDPHLASACSRRTSATT